jgi:hypothetical protein
MAAIFTVSSGAAQALAVQKAGCFVAWGHGDEAWDDDPVAPPSDAIGLVDEIGRRPAASMQFVVPDDDGEIIVQGAHYSLADEPTRYLYVLATFDNPDAAGEDVREAAVFIGTEVSLSVPEEQLYVAPTDLTNFGQMLLLDRFLKLSRTTDFSVSLGFVLNF